METSLNKNIQNYFRDQTKAAPLAVFRFLFGAIMCISIIRFWYNGWIEKLYLLPNFHFKYAGFEFVSVPGNFTYFLFFVCGLSALTLALGFKYRISILTFFISFTYIELLDKTTYLNHYYFISIIAFLLLWMPAHRYMSIDADRNENLRSNYIPRWNIDALKIMLAIVYIYAGLAKLNSDWMLHAMPLAIWLPTKFNLPFLGDMVHESWLHYFASWAGAIYDLFIVFFLLNKKTRVPAYLVVIVFHVLTRILFPIGMFPFIMIASTLIFFSPAFHEKFAEKIASLFKLKKSIAPTDKIPVKSKFNSYAPYLVSAFILFQIIFPLRYLIHDGNVFWNERGYRFSWRVMLMEKTAYANFKIVDGKSGKRFYVQNDDFLTSFQEKQMATQPDFILEYAKYLGGHFASQGHQNVEVYVDSYASLNGRPSQVFVHADVDLMKINYNVLCEKYIHPCDEKI